MTHAPVGEDRLLGLRDEFPGLDDLLHFISHSLGAMPRGAGDALERYARTWRERGIRAWEEDWFELPTRAGSLIAGLIGAPAGSVSMHENVTTAQAIALSCLPFTPPRNRLVCTDEDFPSVLYLYEGLARRGIEIVRVAAGDGRAIDAADVVAAIDERTAVVAVSHVMFRTAQVLDLAPIARRAREAGARTLIDAYQSVGTLPIDVTALGLDFLTGGSVKWLCGGPGASYLYASAAARAELCPAFTGWMAHELPFDFDSGPMRWHAGPRHFWTGTPGVPCYAAAMAGYALVSRAGVAAIRDKSLRQTGRMLALADEYGFPVVSPRDPERRGGTVVISVPRAADVTRAMLDRDALLDFRPGVGMRLAPHFYTRDDELDRVMAMARDEARRLG